jgi:hypothetical protein
MRLYDMEYSKSYCRRYWVHLSIWKIMTNFVSWFGNSRDSNIAFIVFLSAIEVIFVEIPSRSSNTPNQFFTVINIQFERKKQNDIELRIHKQKTIEGKNTIQIYSSFLLCIVQIVFINVLLYMTWKKQKVLLKNHLMDVFWQFE